jgi:hypothetical protein
LKTVVAELLAEIKRRHRLRDLVARAGYQRSTDDEWVERADVTRAVAKLTGEPLDSKRLGSELKQFLLLEGWRQRRSGPRGWMWNARKKKRAGS